MITFRYAVAAAVPFAMTFIIAIALGKSSSIIMTAAILLMSLLNIMMSKVVPQRYSASTLVTNAMLFVVFGVQSLVTLCHPSELLLTIVPMTFSSAMMVLSQRSLSPRYDRAY